MSWPDKFGEKVNLMHLAVDGMEDRSTDQLFQRPPNPLEV